jgi:hypothetical protein
MAADKAMFINRGHAKSIMEIVFLLGAEQELQEAYDRVTERRPGKEHSFLTDVESRLEHLKSSLLLGGSTEGDIADCLSQGIHSAFYVVESDRIVIHSISDLRRSPEQLRERLPLQ